MACGLSFSMLASDGSSWTITLGGGQITATATTGASVVLLRDFFKGTQNTFQLDIVGGQFLVIPVGTSATAPFYEVLSESNGDLWFLFVDASGLLYTKFWLIPEPSPVLGQILPSNGAGYPPAYQPGGPYTPVLAPVQGRGGGTLASQLPNETTGRYFGPCAHNFQNYRVSFQALCGVPSALILCPLCSILIRTMTVPDFQNSTTNPIVMG